ncbi:MULTISPECIES: glycosyltransferase [unclassified Agarivorans]|uniref:glycosyltransferase n=2 Tax=Agarivorans TaxID=261825 RepID=UPI003D7D7CAC
MNEVTIDKPKLVMVTNLYPLPWEPNRGKFNYQQFALLQQDYQLAILVPVAFTDWWRNRRQIKQSTELRYCPYFYTPKIGRRFYSVTMFLSLLIHSGLWLFKFKPQQLMACWAFPDAVACSWLARLFSLPFFFKVHGSDINQLGSYPGRAKQIKAAADKAISILSVSQDLAKKLVSLGIEEQKVKVIYNGVNHQLFDQCLPAKMADDYLLYIGNLKHDKGVVELLQAFTAIAEQFAELKLVYAGSGGMLAKLQQMTAEAGLTQRVVFLGAVAHEELPQWLGHAKLLALPSYAEGVPNVVLEAMASGTPVLATKVGGIPEIFNPALCGCLVEPRNTEAVAKGLQTILEQSWDKEAIKACAAPFTWQRNQQQLLSMLSQAED